MTEPPGRFSFALASCQYPSGLLDRNTPSADEPRPVTDIGVAYRSIARLAERVKQFDLVLLCGDQIYADETAGLFDPASLDESLLTAYTTLRRVVDYDDVAKYGKPEAMLDDHEIGDNWEPDTPNGPSAELRQKRHDGVNAYLGRWRIPSRERLAPPYKDGDRLWFSFEESGLHFFMADTRTARTHRSPATLTSASILGTAQWDALARWIMDAPRDRPSFLLSPSIVLPRRLATAGDPLCAIRSDAWDGYPASLHALLALLLDVGNDRIVLVSGDEHLSCVARVVLSRASAPRRQVVIHAIESSALYAPYPFANSIPEDLAGDDGFELDESADPARCDVTTWFPPAGDGFAVISVERDSRGWTLHVCFDRAGQGSAARCYRL